MIFADTAHTATVDVPDMPRDPFVLALLQNLEKHGFDNATLHGGALRDMYRGDAGAIRDYDIWVNFADDAPAPLAAGMAHFTQIIRATFPGARIISAPPLRHTTSRSQCWGKIEFVLDGRRIDLSMTTLPYDLSAKALAADAPLNAVAMDSRGVVRAHPEFTAHVRAGLYAPLPCIERDVAAARFNSLSLHIKGLRTIPPVIPAPRP